MKSINQKTLIDKKLESSIFKIMLKNKIAFITGANGGIGKAIVKDFIKNRAKIICAVRKIDKDFLKFIQSNKRNIIQVMEFDLLDEEKMKNEIKKLHKSKLKIDTLINCAGITNGSIFELTSQKKLKQNFEVNFFSQINLTQMLLTFLKNKKNSSIINIGSISGIIPDKGYLSYGSSKAAMMYATKIMANELSIYGIRVNCIAPGITKTKMIKNMDKNFKKKYLEENFLQTDCKPEQIGNLASFLASDLSSHINGQIIRIDGGTRS